MEINIKRFRKANVLLTLGFFAFSCFPMAYASENLTIDKLDFTKMSNKARAIFLNDKENFCTSYDNSIQKPELIFSEHPIEKVRISYTGLKAEVIDYNRFQCLNGSNPYNGSAGSPLIIIVKGKIFKFGLARGWKLTSWNESRILLVDRHGTWCDLPGYRVCIEAFIFEKDEFLSATKSIRTQ